jgi:ATP/maltotriose-dependent transcriptional regulator MalT
VSVPTVKTHISHILQKLDVGNRRAAADKARELGLIE